MKNHLTEEQADQLREALRGHQLEAIITLALVTGLRRDELLGLQWQDLDLERRELRVLNSKTKSSHRIIHLPQEFYSILEQAGLPRLRFHDLRQARWRALQSSVKPEA